MITMVATIDIRRGTRPSIRLWIPFFLIWLLLLPIALLLAPFFLIACLVLWTNPLRVLAIGIEILSALRGTHVEATERRNTVLIEIR